MLAHHLFYNDWSREMYNDIYFHGVGLVNQIGIFSKLCVAIFVFVSGYGLAIATPTNIKPMDFYKHRLKKIYLNYWFVWALFVPVGVFVFGRSLSDAYGDHTALKGILDFFGLLKMFGYDSNNPTWWFYNCIIILYLLFPLLNKWLWKSTYLLVSVAITCGLLFIIPGVNVISGFLFAFLLGMLMVKLPVDLINNSKSWQLIFALLLLSVWRLTKTCPKHIADGLICVGMALLANKISPTNWISCVLEKLGKHSMNMFLVHTFIFYFWFRDFIYITRNPFVIFISLLLSSYLMSVVVEWTKQKLGFYKIIDSNGRC